MRVLNAAAGMAVLALAGAALAQGSGISADQRAAAFDRADGDHDGKLTPDEFMSTARAQAPNNPITSWLGSDKNRDGSVSRPEFIGPMTGEDPSGAPLST